MIDWNYWQRALDLADEYLDDPPGAELLPGIKEKVRLARAGMGSPFFIEAEEGVLDRLQEALEDEGVL